MYQRIIFVQGDFGSYRITCVLAYKLLRKREREMLRVSVHSLGQDESLDIPRPPIDLTLPEVKVLPWPFVVNKYICPQESSKMVFEIFLLTFFVQKLFTTIALPLEFVELLLQANS